MKKDIIYLEQYLKSNRIGLGAFACVFKIDNKALKVFFRENLQKHNAKNEIRMLKNLKHPNIPKFYNSGKIDNKYPSILMEYIEGITLHELTGLNRIVKDIISENTIKAILLQTTEVLSFLHSKNIVHRDIKPTSFMISRNGIVKLIDFATVKKIKKDFLRISGMNAEYKAVEQVTNKITYCKSDIWSLGTILYELITGRQLFDYETIDEIETTETVIPDCNYDLKSLLKLMLQRDVSKRISSIELWQETKELMNREVSERILKKFVSYYLNSPACQAYLERARNCYPFELLDLMPFIEQAKTEKEIHAIAV